MRALCLVLTLILLQGCSKGPETAPERLLRPTPPYWTTIAYTGSMKPVLQGGERIKVLPCAIENVPVGSVVVFEQTAEPQFVCHRVIYKGRAGNGGIYLITKGDNNRERDPIPVSKDNYIGILDIPIKWQE